jgi:hypothetical protein
MQQGSVGKISSDIEAVFNSCDKVTDWTMEISPDSVMTLSWGKGPDSNGYQENIVDLRDIASSGNFKLTCKRPGCVLQRNYVIQLATGQFGILSERTRSYTEIAWCMNYDDNKQLMDLFSEYTHELQAN